MKTDYTLVEVQSIADSYYGCFIVNDRDADIKLSDLLENKRTSIFLFECQDAYCEVRMTNPLDEEDQECDVALASSVTVLSKAQYAERQRTIDAARFKKDLASIAALQSLIVVA